jgi:hypothetical protein
VVGKEYIVIKKILTLGLFAFATLTLSQTGNPTVSAATTPGANPSGTGIDSYRYVAQDGDSYSHMARKAVQTYGIKTNTKLSLAQILFAENGLTADAGNTEVNLGQTVNIKKSTVGSWIEKAKKLTAEQQAGWTTYVPLVDFNTNAVGEKRA